MTAIPSSFCVDVRPPHGSPQGKDAPTGIKEGNELLMAAIMKQDAAAAAALYTDDAELFPPGQERVAGKKAIQAFWQTALNSGLKAVKLKTSEVRASGDLAYEIGTYESIGAKEVVLERGEYCVIWRYQDQKWKLHRDIWNRLSPAKMQRNVSFLTSDECEGRAGSLGIERAAVYIAGQLKEAGLKPAGVNKTWFQPFPYGKNNLVCKNVIGVLEGAGPLAEETIVIGAHYDHLGSGKGGKAIYRGADDNASGTAAMMELARRLPPCLIGRAGTSSSWLSVLKKPVCTAPSITATRNPFFLWRRRPP